MRLAGRAKAGFYPTPPATLEHLVRLLAPYKGDLEGGAALDPSVGDGVAIEAIAQALGMTPYGIELDAERAKLARKRLKALGGRVRTGDALAYQGGGFDLLFLNPPYDTSEDGERLEVKFLKHWSGVLDTGGLLIMVVPEHVMPMLLPHLEHFRLHLYARIARDEYPRFKQVVYVGIRTDRPTLRQHLPEPPYLDEVGELSLFGLLKTIFKPRLQALPEDPAALLRRAREAGAWSEVEGEEIRYHAAPLVPLKEAHLALLIAGGLLDLKRVTLNGVPHLLLGVLEKDTELVIEEGEKKVHGQPVRVRKEIERERFVVKIRALDLETLELVEVS